MICVVGGPRDSPETVPATVYTVCWVYEHHSVPPSVRHRLYAREEQDRQKGCSGLIQSFILVGRPYFHKYKNSKYAWHFIGLITKEWKVLQKTIICVCIWVHFQQIRKYKEDKMKVRNWGKYKYEECVHVMAIDGRWKTSFFALRSLPMNLNNCTARFLAHRSRSLEWAIVIAHRPSSVRPSSVRPSSSSVNFSHFQLLLQNR